VDRRRTRGGSGGSSRRRKDRREVPMRVQPREDGPVEEVAPSTAWRTAAIIVLGLALGIKLGVATVVVIVAIVVMIFLHELGHYLTAKWAGMKVTEFFIGFGPRLWSFQRG